MPDPKLVDNESGIVEGSDTYIEYDLFDDNTADDNPSQPTAAEAPTEGAKPQEAAQQQQPEAQSQQSAKASNDAVTDLKERQLATTVIPALQNEIKQYKDEIAKRDQSIAAFKELQTTVQNFGLSPQEAQVGFQLASSWKSDPAGTIQKLLTYAASKGIKIEGAPAPAVTREMLASIVEEKLSPVLQKARQEEQLQQQQFDAQRQATEFLTEYPDASIHQGDIATVMQQYNFTPQRAYLELYKYAAQNGLDWNQPLAPQIRAKQTPNPNPVTTPQGNGYSPGVRQASSMPVQEVDLPGDDSSYRSILNSVLAEFGVSR